MQIFKAGLEICGTSSESSADCLPIKINIVAEAIKLKRAAAEVWLEITTPDVGLTTFGEVRE